MSRCFPYPPSGYALSSARKGALIESIKLQNEMVKAKEHRRKEKKREKKEKRKEKKEKKNLTLNKPNIVRGHVGEKFCLDSRVKFFHKGSKDESEQLEQSSLTEEHEKPVCLRYHSYSSDSTENSNKRKRDSSPFDVNRGHGNVIRIRLPSRKQNRPNALADEQQVRCTSGRTHFCLPKKDDHALRLKSEGCTSELASCNLCQGLVLTTDREQMSSTSKQVENVAAEKTLISPATDAVMTPMLKEEVLYKNLIENWFPPQLQDACLDTRDLDWLLQHKNEGVQPEKRPTHRDDRISYSGSAALWPRAQYLPEIDVYALPFRVPF